MKPQGKLKIILIYECMGKEIPIAETSSRLLLAEAKRSVLEDGEARIFLARQVDPVLCIQEVAELRMKKKVLDLLIRENSRAREAA